MGFNDNERFEMIQLQSNSIEANARMCMTSSVSGYIAALGSDHPPGAYEDIESADMINFFGHNARGSHSVLFWRVVAEITLTRARHPRRVISSGGAENGCLDDTRRAGGFSP